MVVCRRPINAQPTGENGPSFTLLLHATLLLARHRKGRLKHKTTDVVALLKVGLPLLRLLVIEVWHDVRHLDVGVLGVQVLWVHLRVWNSR